MDETKDSEFRLDRSHFSVARLDDPSDDVEYWASKIPAERLRAIEHLSGYYGYARFTVMSKWMGCR